MITPCRFLFNKEAKELYDPSVLSEDFVNQSLATLMTVNTIFLSRQENDGFAFIDPAAFNNQCHLYSYLAGRLRAGYKMQSEEQKQAQTQENRFLHLAFILSNTFLTDRNLICRTIEGMLERKELSLQVDKKRFYAFIKDSLSGYHGLLIRTARKELNEVFEGCIKGLLASKRSDSPLHNELSLLAHEELRLKQLYTFPKFAGVLFLLHEGIPCVFKCKIVTEMGTGFLAFATEALSPDTPVLAFEGLASETHSLEKIRKVAEQCPHYVKRKPSSKQRHPESEECLFCTKKQVEPARYQERFQRAMSDLQRTLLALGADFVLQEQPGFTKLLEKYPLISERFTQACQSIEELGLGMKLPSTFTVDHVYLDSFKNVTESPPRICMSPEAFLQSRGYL